MANSVFKILTPEAVIMTINAFYQKTNTSRNVKRMHFFYLVSASTTLERYSMVFETDYFHFFTTFKQKIRM